MVVGNAYIYGDTITATSSLHHEWKGVFFYVREQIAQYNFNAELVRNGTAADLFGSMKPRLALGYWQLDPPQTPFAACKSPGGQRKSQNNLLGEEYQRTTKKLHSHSTFPKYFTTN